MAEDKEVKISKKVSGIIENVQKLTVMELAELVKALEDTFGVSAAPMAAAPAANAAGPVEAAEEKTEFDVVITAAGDQKIQAIKAVRTIRNDLGLADAKKLVESAPAIVLEKAKKEDAEEAKQKLVAAGATVELK